MPSDSAPEPAAAPQWRWRRWLLSTATGPLCFGLLQLGVAFPEWTESCYSRSVYPWIQAGLVAVSGWLPCSLGELLLAFGASWALVAMARLLRRIWLQPRRALPILLQGLATGLAVSSVLVGIFLVLWGWNHARLPLARHLELPVKAVERAALVRVAERLAGDCNRLRPVGLDPLLWPAEWSDWVAEAYEVSARELPTLAGPRPPLRRAWLSPVLTWSSVTGIYSPFTGEAHVNAEPPGVLMLAVACHEVAHLRGYAREDEANFLAYWVAVHSPQPALAYSGTLFALRELLFQLWLVDSAGRSAVFQSLAPEVLADLAAIDAFWQRRPPTVTKVLTVVAQKTNDSYLKAAGHADGVRSYGRMTDLLVALLDR